MRVIGGEFRSRVLKSLPGLDVRPTPDRLRESLFSVLAPRMEGVTFVDAYAGTGAVGIEAISRGAKRAIFLEQSQAAVMVIRANLKALGIDGRTEVRRGRATSSLGKLGADIVFLDPPYRLDQEYELALNLVGTAPPPLVIVQHDVRRKLQETYGLLKMERMMKQGDNVLTFFAPSNA
jgi:16S rRNA (guanine(966)-N(2))-methyltransferase RsmD